MDVIGIRMTLTVHAISLDDAASVAVGLPIDIRLDKSLGPDEWYLEYQGQRVGSKGV